MNMLTTKALRWGLLTMTVALVFTACSGGSKNSPGKVAENFLMAVQDMDFEKAKLYATKESASMLDMLAGFAGMGDEEKPEPAPITITNEEIDGDKATVTYTSKNEDGEETEDTIDLVKEEGEWKVKFDKSSLGGGDTDMDMEWEDVEEDMEEDLEEIGDSVGAVMDEVEEGVEDSG
jgi:hypothetical protein